MILSETIFWRFLQIKPYKTPIDMHYRNEHKSFKTEDKAIIFDSRAVACVKFVKLKEIEVS